MKVDLYTKCVLTIIAGALLGLCIENAVHPQRVAADTIQRVVIAGVDILSTPAGFPVHNLNLPVEVKNGPLSVQVVAQKNSR
jgi:hypothetical protein